MSTDLLNKTRKWLKRYYLWLLLLLLLVSVGGWALYRFMGARQPIAYTGWKPFNVFEGFAAGGIKQPTGLAVGPNQQLYIIDSGNKRITVLQPDGRYAFSFGGPGSGLAELDQPVSIKIDRIGRVYVVDKTKEGVIVFDSEGTYLTTIVGKPAGSFRPWSIAIDRKGQLIAFDASSAKLKLYPPTKQWQEIFSKPDEDSGFFTAMEVEPEQSWVLGINSDHAGYNRVSADDSDVYGSDWIINPQGIVYQPAPEQILVSDASDNTIVVFNAEGDYLGEFGGTGMEMNQFLFPAGLALDGQGKLYVADKYNNRIVVYGK